MAFRVAAEDYKIVQGKPNYNSGSGTAYTGMVVVDLTAGVANVATGTDVPTHIVPEKGLSAANSLTVKSMDLIPARGVRVYADIEDENSDGFDQAMTGGTSTTIIDTANRNEADNYWNSGYVTHLGLGQTRRITDFVQSTKTITIESAFTNQDDTDHTNASGEKYSITTLYPGITAANINADGSKILSETKTSGKVTVVGIPNLNTVGKEFVQVELTSEA